VSTTIFASVLLNLFKIAKKHSNGKPEIMVTDGLQSYNDAFKKEFYSRKSPQTKHIRDSGDIQEEEE